MRLTVIFVLLSLSVIVRGWATLIKPIALSVGAAFAALNLDVDFISDLQPTALNIWFSKGDKGKITEEEVEKHPQIKRIDKIIEKFKKLSDKPPRKWEVEGLEDMEFYRGEMKKKIREGDMDLVPQLDLMSEYNKGSSEVLLREILTYRNGGKKVKLVVSAPHE